MRVETVKQQTEYRQLKTLKKYPGNPRIIKDQQFKTLCISIKENPDYFEARPIILSDRTGDLIIIAGNQRYEAAKANGLKEAPTFLMSGLTDEKEKEIVIRDNISNGDFDWDILANEWAEMPLEDWGIDLPDYAAGHEANSMDENNIDLEQEFDPVGVSKGYQKIVITFKNKEDADMWVNIHPEIMPFFRKQNMAWTIDYTSGYKENE